MRHCQAQGIAKREALPSGEMLLRLQVGPKALTLRGKEAGRFRKVAGVSIVDVGASFFFFFLLLFVRHRE